ncbi:hypothetical protein BC826DRAFT_1009143 [Russula brevipes]|nr:hypothetical protein BC826DRAFT_1009143 [Russula brevipes]
MRSHHVYICLGSPQTKVMPKDDDPARLSQSSDESTNTNTPRSKVVGPPPVQHDRFFFDEGNVTFLVDGVLYRVHGYFFCRDSKEFRDRLSGLSTQQASSSTPIIPLEGVKSVDFDAFLSVLYPLNFNTVEERTFEEWSSILDLSTRWGFTSIRDLAVRCMKPPSPLKQLLLARKCSVEEWRLPALVELCKNPKPPSLDEARLMDFEDVVLVGSVRQIIRSSTITANGAEISDCIQAWTRGEPWTPPSVPPPSPGVVDIEIEEAEHDGWGFPSSLNSGSKKKKGKKK